jgi:hypothetical protein
MTDRVADAYRRQAEDCRKQAAQAFHPGDRAEWLRLAEAWSRMAGDVQQLASDGPVPTRIKRPDL